MSTLWEKREAWDGEDRQQHLETIMRNMRKDAVYVDKGSFSPDEAPSKQSKNDDNPENKGGLTP